MKAVAQKGQIWVWTKKAETVAGAMGFVRKAGQPATMAGKELGRYAPTVWTEKGYVEAVQDGK